MISMTLPDQTFMMSTSIVMRRSEKSENGKTDSTHIGLRGSILVTSKVTMTIGGGHK